MDEDSLLGQNIDETKESENKDIEAKTENKTFENFDESLNAKNVTVQPVEFAQFDSSSQTYGEENKNLDLLLDIKLCY